MLSADCKRLSSLPAPERKSVAAAISDELRTMIVEGWQPHEYSECIGAAGRKFGVILTRSEKQRLIEQTTEWSN